MTEPVQPTAPPSSDGSGTPPAGSSAAPTAPSGGPQSIAVTPPPAPPAAPAAPAGGGDVYRPEGIGADLIGANDRETIDNLFKQNKGFRESMGRRGAVPEKPEGYSLGTVPEAVTKKLGDLANDPVIPLVKSVAHKVGMSDKEFQSFMPELLDAFDKAGLIPDRAPLDPEAQIGELERDHADIADPRERRLHAARRIPQVKNQLDNLLVAKVLTKDEHGDLLGMLPAAKSFRLLEKIVGSFARPDGSVAPGGGSSPAGASESDILNARMDPRYDSRSPKYDPRYREETDRKWRDSMKRRA